MNKLFKLERLFYNHRFRSQVESKVAKKYPRGSSEFVVVMSALDDVIETRGDKKRRNGESWRRHEFAVLAQALTHCPDENVAFYLACIKHDMPEDHGDEWPVERIRNGKYGKYGAETADLVEDLTEPEKLPGETKEVYTKRKFDQVASGGVRSKKIKIMDRNHNLSTLPKSGPIEKQAEYLAETRKFILPWVEELGFMEEEFKALLKKHEFRVERQLKRRKGRKK